MASCKRCRDILKSLRGLFLQIFYTPSHNTRWKDSQQGIKQLFKNMFPYAPCGGKKSNMVRYSALVTVICAKRHKMARCHDVSGSAIPLSNTDTGFSCTALYPRVNTPRWDNACCEITGWKSAVSMSGNTADDFSPEFTIKNSLWCIALLNWDKTYGHLLSQP